MVKGFPSSLPGDFLGKKEKKGPNDHSAAMWLRRRCPFKKTPPATAKGEAKKVQPAGNKIKGKSNPADRKLLTGKDEK